MFRVAITINIRTLPVHHALQKCTAGSPHECDLHGNRKLVELKFGRTSGGSCGLDTRESQDEAAINQLQQTITICRYSSLVCWRSAEVVSSHCFASDIQLGAASRGQRLDRERVQHVQERLPGTIYFKL